MTVIWETNAVYIHIHQISRQNHVTPQEMILYFDVPFISLLVHQFPSKLRHIMCVCVCKHTDKKTTDFTSSFFEKEGEKARRVVFLPFLPVWGENTDSHISSGTYTYTRSKQLQSPSRHHIQQPVNRFLFWLSFFLLFLPLLFPSLYYILPWLHASVVSFSLWVYSLSQSTLICLQLTSQKVSQQGYQKNC